MIRYFLCILLASCCLFTTAKQVQLRYRAPQGSAATLIWGLNNWGYATDQPAGTVIKDKVMHSPMGWVAGEFVITLNVPEGSTIDYLFEYTRVQGPFRASFTYLDINEGPEQKFYHTIVKGDAVITVSPVPGKPKLVTQLSLLAYTASIFFSISALTLICFLYRRFKRTGIAASTNSVPLFFAIAVSTFLLLFMIRAIVTGLAVEFLIAPLRTIPMLVRTSFGDLWYTMGLAALFGVFFLAFKKRQKQTLRVFAVFGAISVLLCMINIQVTALLGRPFTYQWLYYSDFLHSSDASRAIGSNIDKKTISSQLLMLLTAIPLLFVTRHAIAKSPKWTAAILIACVLTGFVTNPTGVNAARTANPVVYFAASLMQQDGVSILSGDHSQLQPGFEVKNINVLQPGWAKRFEGSGVKNLIIFVLESTPAEYVTPFNQKFKTTPFLDSIKSSAILFDGIYAHSPATNKSMVSLLCSAYPYLSFKSITAEKPDINWPSITSELKKAGYHSSFFNSGDNRFQGADSFLKYRGFGLVEDYRVNPFGATTFSDAKYANENLEGINDSCLPVKFFNWIKKGEDKPFFSMMWTYQTHYPYYPTGNRTVFPVNDESQQKYLNALRSADNALKQLVDGLKKRNLFESTLIVVVGDHGEAFGRHGQITHAGGIYEENLHIPLMLINPVLFNGSHSSELGGISDIAPTILSVLGKPSPAAWQGENLFSINRRKKVYFFSPYSDYLFGCREGDFKYIYNATNDVAALYDLHTDPSETTDVSAKYPDLAKAINAHLHGWMRYQSDHVNAALK
jgi:lipoteichoic acid synthase